MITDEQRNVETALQLLGYSGDIGPALREARVGPGDQVLRDLVLASLLLRVAGYRARRSERVVTGWMEDERIRPARLTTYALHNEEETSFERALGEVARLSELLEKLDVGLDADPWTAGARAAVDAAELLLFGPVRALTAAELEPDWISQRNVSLGGLDRAFECCHIVMAAIEVARERLGP